MPTTTFEIFPPIGIARVGTSTAPDGFFLGPEPGVTPPSKYRDATGKLKRQAARFRIFRCSRDDNGKLTAAAEITRDDVAQLTWTVHPVNRKGASPRFVVGGVVNTNPNVRRNNATGNDVTDANLIIDPKAQSVDLNNSTKLFDQGKYHGKPVPLGEIRMEADSARLLVLGGFGSSASANGSAISGFAENDSWQDDVSDGPVTAQLVLKNNQTPPVVPAWVIVGPPDFAPGITNLVTLYDTLYSLAVDRGLASKGRIAAPRDKPFYESDILPILRRAMGYQWVNRFARTNHGPNGSGDFTSADFVGIEDPNKAQDVRAFVFSLLRDPASATPSTATNAMPRLFSDDYPQKTPLPLTTVQYKMMRQWAQNNFNVGAGPVAQELLPDQLTRFALEACAGGAFWPGIEAGRVLRNADKYLANEPFRLDHAKVAPGELTGSMALPWQADFFDCAWEGATQSGLGWWPAQRPDDVLPGPAATVTQPWRRKVDSPDELVIKWSRLGVVVNVSAGPNDLFVETERDPTL